MAAPDYSDWLDETITAPMANRSSHERKFLGIRSPDFCSLFVLCGSCESVAYRSTLTWYLSLQRLLNATALVIRDQDSASEWGACCRCLLRSLRLARAVELSKHLDDPVVEDALGVDSVDEVRVAERARPDTLVDHDAGDAGTYPVDVLRLGERVPVSPEYGDGSPDVLQGIARGHSLTIDFLVLRCIIVVLAETASLDELSEVQKVLPRRSGGCLAQVDM